MAKRKSTASQKNSEPKRNKKSPPNEGSDEDEGIDHSLSELNDSLDYTIRSGKILTVKLRNFMCHANLTVDFNPRTNLLIGQNGSGKSAILTALIIGLGAKANATNRSSSIKDLIKTGESSATIEVHISNDGSDAYEYGKYGNRIVVVRQIAASGSSTYKLKNASGNVISTSRAELLKLILYMNIQVDNPVCVMTQDASRGFLRDSNPKKRFELFYKATQLDVIIEKLDQATHQFSVAKTKFFAQRRLHANNVEEQKKAHEKLNQFKSMEPLKKETNRYKSERAWLSVIQEEELIKAVNTNLEQAQQKKIACEENLAKCNVSDSEMTEQAAQLSEEIERLQLAFAEEQQKMTAEKTKYKQALNQITENERKVRSFEARIANVQATIATLDENIQAETNSNKNQIDELKQANELKLQDLQKRLEDNDATLKSHRRELEIYTNTRTKCISQKEASKRQQTQFFEEKRKVQMRLQHMHSSPKENLKLYGDNMVKLVELLEQNTKNGKFQKMPIGPIANHVEVKDGRYRQYVEDALGTILNAFCVDNTNDLMTFRDIMKKMSFNVPLICSQFHDQQYNVAGKCVEADAHTRRLMDLIVVDSPVVMNCLIDQCNIETILFTQSFEHATHITSKKENVPKNLSRVILLNPYSEYFPAPSYRSYTKQSRPSRNLRVNAAGRENAYKIELAEINEKIEKAKAELMHIENKITENTKLVEGRCKLINELESNLTMIRLEITEIKSVEFPQEADVEVMLNEKNEQSRILDTIKANYDQEKSKNDELKGKIDETKRTLTEIRDRLKDIENEIEEKRKAKEEIGVKFTKRDSMIAYHRKQIKSLDDALGKYEQELVKVREKLNRLEATAQKTGPRIEVTHDEEELAKLIKKNESKLNAVSMSNESIESVTRQAEEADQNVLRSDELVRILHSALKMMDDAIKKRMKRVQQLKNHMITRTSIYFTDIMKLRDIDGTLDFDIDAETLDIQVIPRDKDVENAVCKTTNLSGGERSYTTVAFLISLWSCVDHPFYFLDEYDVFTDQINRMFMTKLLLAEAKKKTLQYTFLTPQDTSEIKKSKDLSILRLENPNR